jgi:hypothetical protein
MQYGLMLLFLIMQYGNRSEGVQQDFIRWGVSGFRGYETKDSTYEANTRVRPRKIEKKYPPNRVFPETEIDWNKTAVFTAKMYFFPMKATLQHADYIWTLAIFTSSALGV